VNSARTSNGSVGQPAGIILWESRRTKNCSDGWLANCATKFKQRVDAVIEKFNDMRDDLDKERKFMTRPSGAPQFAIFVDGGSLFALDHAPLAPVI
jgi:hypothetical protein